MTLTGGYCSHYQLTLLKTRDKMATQTVGTSSKGCKPIIRGLFNTKTLQCSNCIHSLHFDCHICHVFTKSVSGFIFFLVHMLFIICDYFCKWVCVWGEGVKVRNSMFLYCITGYILNESMLHFSFSCKKKNHVTKGKSLLLVSGCFQIFEVLKQLFMFLRCFIQKNFTVPVNVPQNPQALKSRFIFT